MPDLPGISKNGHQGKLEKIWTYPIWKCPECQLFLVSKFIFLKLSATLWLQGLLRYSVFDGLGKNSTSTKKYLPYLSKNVRFVQMPETANLWIWMLFRYYRHGFLRFFLDWELHLTLIKFGFNPQAPISQKNAHEVVFRRF